MRLNSPEFHRTHGAAIRAVLAAAEHPLSATEVYRAMDAETRCSRPYVRERLLQMVVDGELTTSAGRQPNGLWKGGNATVAVRLFSLPGRVVT